MRPDKNSTIETLYHFLRANLEETKARRLRNAISLHPGVSEQELMVKTMEAFDEEEWINFLSLKLLEDFLEGKMAPEAREIAQSMKDLVMKQAG